MTLDAPDSAGTLDSCLREGLRSLAGAVAHIGAQSVSVMLVEHGRASRIVYHWPETAIADDVNVFGGGGAPAAPDAEDDEENAIARLLNAAVHPESRSLLLVRWPEGQAKVILAFGFAEGASVPSGVPAGTWPVLQLAAVAAWSVSEIRRVRGELTVVNDRLGRRKTVERAKGALQARHGWSERQAYEHLRRLSRQRRKTMADIADEILRV